MYKPQIKYKIDPLKTVDYRANKKWDGQTNGRTDRQTDRDGRTDKSKTVCPSGLIRAGHKQ